MVFTFITQNYSPINEKNGNSSPSSLIFFSAIFIAGTNGSPQLEDIANLIKALRWPSDINFPCIDLVRMSLVNPLTAELLLTKHSEELLDLLLQNLSSSSKAANQMLALRSLANLFASDKGTCFKQGWPFKYMHLYNSMCGTYSA